MILRYFGQKIFIKLHNSSQHKRKVGSFNHIRRWFYNFLYTIEKAAAYQGPDYLYQSVGSHLFPERGPFPLHCAPNQNKKQQRINSYYSIRSLNGHKDCPRLLLTWLANGVCTWLPSLCCLERGKKHKDCPRRKTWTRWARHHILI